MRVDHRCSHILVSDELLDGADVVTPFQQMRCKGVPECVATGALAHSSVNHRPLYSPLHHLDSDDDGLERLIACHASDFAAGTPMASPIRGWRLGICAPVRRASQHSPIPPLDRPGGCCGLSVDAPDVLATGSEEAGSGGLTHPCRRAPLPR